MIFEMESTAVFDWVVFVQAHDNCSIQKFSFSCCFVSSYTLSFIACFFLVSYQPVGMKMFVDYDWVGNFYWNTFWITWQIVEREIFTEILFELHDK